VIRSDLIILVPEHSRNTTDHINLINCNGTNTWSHQMLSLALHTLNPTLPYLIWSYLVQVQSMQCFATPLVPVWPVCWHPTHHNCSRLWYN